MGLPRFGRTPLAGFDSLLRRASQNRTLRNAPAGIGKLGSTSGKCLDGKETPLTQIADFLQPGAERLFAPFSLFPEGGEIAEEMEERPVVSGLAHLSADSTGAPQGGRGWEFGHRRNPPDTVLERLRHLNSGRAAWCPAVESGDGRKLSAVCPVSRWEDAARFDEQGGDM